MRAVIATGLDGAQGLREKPCCAIRPLRLLNPIIATKVANATLDAISLSQTGRPSIDPELIPEADRRLLLRHSESADLRQNGFQVAFCINFR